VEGSHARNEGDIATINSDVEIGYLLIACALLGVIWVGGLLSALHLDRWHPKPVGAAVGKGNGRCVAERRSRNNCRRKRTSCRFPIAHTARADSMCLLRAIRSNRRSASLKKRTRGNTSGA
jgi:hypothetical protein